MKRPQFWSIFARTSWRDRRLRGASQAGLVNNLNDGITWGVFPLLFTNHGLGLAAVGVIKGLYPLLWGLGQIPTGRLADRIGRKPLIVEGNAHPVRRTRARLGSAETAAARRRGLSHRPRRRHRHGLPHTDRRRSPTTPIPPGAPTPSGAYRFWRDIGYAAGALVAGIIADAFNLDATVIAAAILTGVSGLLAARWITETPSPATPAETNVDH